MDIKLYITKGFKRILRPPAIRESRIDATARVCSGSNINYSSLGKYSYIGNDCYTFKANIGNYCSIGDNCKIGAPSHPMGWVSTSPVFCCGRNVMKKNFATFLHQDNEMTDIGHDVWIGESVLIKSGISVGNGAVVGMGSVVTHDIPAYEIWAGNPARLIRKRFDDDTIEKLLQMEWWEWSDEKIQQAAVHFDDVDAFLGAYKE